MGLYCDLIRLSDPEVAKCVELSDEKAIYALLQHNRSDDWSDIDKAWHGIHFILNRAYSTEAPFDFLLRGGRALNNHNWREAYGVDVPDMHAFDSIQVKEISNALSSFTERGFRKRYDPGAMIQHRIYPGIWEERKDLILSSSEHICDRETLYHFLIK